MLAGIFVLACLANCGICGYLLARYKAMRAVVDELSDIVQVNSHDLDRLVDEVGRPQPEAEG